MQTIPLNAVPSQITSFQVAGQNLVLSIYQRSTGLYIDIVNDGAVTISGVICEDRNRIVRNRYLGLLGDFAWFDTEGTADPYYTGIGTRFLLAYIPASELAFQDADADPRSFS